MVPFRASEDEIQAVNSSLGNLLRFLEKISIVGSDYIYYLMFLFISTTFLKTSALEIINETTSPAIKNKGDRLLIKYDQDNHYIVAAFGPIMLSYGWYEVYHFEELSPRTTLLELGYVISGPLVGTIEIKEEKLIRNPMFIAIEVYLVVREYMKEKYKDYPIEELDLNI